MPRGKNYVNQHKGMALKAASKEAVTELCYYGNACQRKDCIYRHEQSSSSSSSLSTTKSSDPCMAYLSGFCSFTSKTCRKRHPTSDAEVESLIRKYAAIHCRFGVNCKTKGCLYMHPNPDSSLNPPELMLQTSSLPNPYIPGPYGPPPVRRLGPSAKAIRRTLMDPNAFPPLGADVSSTVGMNASTCLPVTMDSAPQAIAPIAPSSLYPFQNGTSIGPPSTSLSNDFAIHPGPNAQPPSSFTESSSSSWNLSAQEFVPRGVM